MTRTKSPRMIPLLIISLALIMGIAFIVVYLNAGQPQRCERTTGGDTNKGYVTYYYAPECFDSENGLQ